MRTRFAKAAEDDLEAIGDWIAEDNPNRAISFVLKIKERCARIGHMPKAYPLVPRHEESGIRRCAFGGYLIFYRVTDVVEVLRVIHGARDVDRLLFPTDE
jgi:toxin ParE1/3/4